MTRQTMLALVFKLGMCAQKSFRRLRGFESLAKVITGVKFKDGIEVIQKMHHRSKTEVSRVAA
jgi:putative transposase